MDEPGDVVALELDRRKVDGDGQRLRPGRGLAAGLRQAHSPISSISPLSSAIGINVEGGPTRGSDDASATAPRSRSARRDRHLRLIKQVEFAIGDRVGDRSRFSPSRSRYGSPYRAGRSMSPRGLRTWRGRARRWHCSARRSPHAVARVTATPMLRPSATCDPNSKSLANDDADDRRNRRRRPVARRPNAITMRTRRRHRATKAWPLSCSRRATSRRRSSPIACPKLSLISLNRSRSMHSTAKRSSDACARSRVAGQTAR